MKPVKIVVVDSEEIFLEGFATILRHSFQPDAILCGKSVTEVLKSRPDYGEPDIVVLGKDKQISDIADSIKKTKDIFPDAKIVMMMAPDDEENPVDILKCGVFACLSKNIESNELLACLQLILSGRVIVSHCFAEKFFKTLAKTRTYSHKKEVLSKREVEITKLVAQGKTNREISQSLCVTENTVKVHMKHILSKVKCKNRQQLVAFAFLGKSLSMKDVVRP